jgi:hypothetical protein
MIRAFELSGLGGSGQRRIPIMAVSASLVEREKETYSSAGFDGWILKPIDFKRLETLLLGIVDDVVRNAALYVPGEWERGGWFSRGSRGSSESTASVEFNPGQTDRNKGGADVLPAQSAMT